MASLLCQLHFWTLKALSPGSGRQERAGESALFNICVGVCVYVLSSFAARGFGWEGRVKLFFSELCPQPLKLGFTRTTTRWLAPVGLLL